MLIQYFGCQVTRKLRCSMKEFIEKLIGRLEERKAEHLHDEKVMQELEKNNLATFCSAKARALDGAIEIVNQLAEEYNNDVCEWKKTDKRKSSPYHHALKHGNITLEFHDDFKFCPYCGKKIKIAPYQPKGE